MVETLAQYSPYTDSYYIPPPPLAPFPPTMYTFPPPSVPYLPPSTFFPLIIIIPPPPSIPYEYNRVPYDYTEGEGESYLKLSTSEVANLTNLHQDTA